jgi:hypothetical protein
LWRRPRPKLGCEAKERRRTDDSKVISGISTYKETVMFFVKRLVRFLSNGLPIKWSVGIIRNTVQVISEFPHPKVKA